MSDFKNSLRASLRNLILSAYRRYCLIVGEL
jgi:hypothetical protein